MFNVAVDLEIIFLPYFSYVVLKDICKCLIQCCEFLEVTLS